MSDVGTVDYWKAKYEEEYEIVDRVWRALGISCYEDAKGKTIDQLVKELREKCTPPEAAFRARIITECREACMDVHADADEAAKAKDAIGEPYKTGYIDAAIDCDEALFRLLNEPLPQSEPSEAK